MFLRPASLVDLDYNQTDKMTYPDTRWDASLHMMLHFIHQTQLLTENKIKSIIRCVLDHRAKTDFPYRLYKLYTIVKQSGGIRPSIIKYT